MRITCPNCGAQYEVDESLIPESGRDVQCSNCGKGWFQARHPEPEETAAASAAEPVTAEEEVIAVEETVTAQSVATEPADTGETAPEAAAEAAPEPEAEVAPPEAEEASTAATAAEVADADMDEAEAETEAPVTAMVPRKPEEAVLAVLREEAEREIAQRRQETVGLESQPDLGLAEPAARRTGPGPAEIAAGAAVAGAARRDLLPDIDEINSTLRSDADRGAVHDIDDGEVEIERRRGFRMGFGLVILLVAALIGLYLGAGWLARTVPALEPVLAAYVAMANSFRAWVDGLLAAGVDGLSG